MPLATCRVEQAIAAATLENSQRPIQTADIYIAPQPTTKTMDPKFVTGGGVGVMGVALFGKQF